MNNSLYRESVNFGVQCISIVKKYIFFSFISAQAYHLFNIKNITLSDCSSLSLSVSTND